LSEYSQPFEAIGVMIPSGSIDGIDVDLVAAAFCRPEWGFCVSAVNVEAGLGFLERFLPTRKEVTIEETLEAGHGLSGLSDENRRQACDLVRIVINACPLAVERGTRPVQSNIRLTPHERSRERQRIVDPRQAQLLQIQDLPLMPPPTTAAGQPGEEDQAEGRTQPMHRRRGHWKMQPYGPGRSKRKRIFVQGYLGRVRAVLKGEMGRVYSLAVAPDGTALVTSSGEALVLWDLSPAISDGAEAGTAKHF
jgi:hypothetical protein